MVTDGMTEEEMLLDLALKAVIEALRMNPDRYKIIYNSKYDNNDLFLASSRSFMTSLLSLWCY